MKTSRLVLLLFFVVNAFAVSPVEKSAVKPELPKAGVNLARANGGWLNAQVEDHRLVVTFYNTEKKPTPPDATTGLARFDYGVARAPRTLRVALTPADGKPSLVTPQRVLPPHIFKVYLTLSGAAPNASLESYAFQYP